MNNEGKTKRIEVRSQSMNAPDLATLATSLKDRYIIRQRHTRLGSERFWPTNKAEAKQAIESQIDHVLGDTNILSLERSKQDQKANDIYNDISIHHTSAFKATSPVSQDIL